MAFLHNDALTDASGPPAVMTTALLQIGCSGVRHQRISSAIDSSINVANSLRAEVRKVHGGDRHRLGQSQPAAPRAQADSAKLTTCSINSNSELGSAIFSDHEFLCGYQLASGEQH